MTASELGALKATILGHFPELAQARFSLFLRPVVAAQHYFSCHLILCIIALVRNACCIGTAADEAFAAANYQGAIAPPFFDFYR